MVQWLFSSKGGCRFLFSCQEGFRYQQKCGLVNVKLKWVKDKSLDAVITAEKDLRAVCTLVSIISSSQKCKLPIYHLSKHHGQLGLPNDLKLSTFMRRYPSIFHESRVPDTAGTAVPWFELTREATDLHQEELSLLQQNQTDLLERLCKLLMLTRDRTLPLQSIDQLKWDMGMPYNYSDTLIPHHRNLFSLVRLPDDRVGLKLLHWDESLAVSQLQKDAALQQKEEDVRNNCLAFPIGFTRGFGLKRKCMKWLEEWQTLPYTSPYADSSHLDPRTDVSEKRIVGVFHELLHLTIKKKTERKNVSNLRKPLGLPQKFTKVFERHPGIFYISMKCDTQTVVLREAYSCRELLHKHPLVEIRERFAGVMRRGFMDRSRGMYKETADSGNGLGVNPYSSEEESDCNVLSEYESDDSIHDNC